MADTGAGAGWILDSGLMDIHCPRNIFDSCRAVSRGVLKNKCADHAFMSKPSSILIQRSRKKICNSSISIGFPPSILFLRQ